MRRWRPQCRGLHPHSGKNIPDWKGRGTLVNAIKFRIHRGIENGSIRRNPKPNYIGFDIDFGEAIGRMPRLKITYKAVTFAAL